MGMTPKVSHSRFDFNLIFLTLDIFTTEGTKIIIIIIIIIRIIIIKRAEIPAVNEPVGRWHDRMEQVSSPGQEVNL